MSFEVQVAEGDRVVYEYAAQFHIHGSFQDIYSDDWGAPEDAQEKVDRFTTAWRQNGTWVNRNIKMVKRRKAGKVEDV